MCTPVFSQHEMQHQHGSHLPTVSSLDIQEEKWRFGVDLGQYRIVFFFLSTGVGEEDIPSQQLSFAGFLLAPSQPGARQARQVPPSVSVRAGGGPARSHRRSFSPGAPVTAGQIQHWAGGRRGRGWGEGKAGVIQAAGAGGGGSQFSVCAGLGRAGWGGNLASAWAAAAAVAAISIMDLRCPRGRPGGQVRGPGSRERRQPSGEWARRSWPKAEPAVLPAGGLGPGVREDFTPWPQSRGPQGE